MKQKEATEPEEEEDDCEDKEHLVLLSKPELDRGERDWLQR